MAKKQPRLNKAESSRSEDVSEEEPKTPAGKQREAITDSKTINVSNLPGNVTHKHLMEFFEESGRIDGIEFCPYGPGCIVTFAEVEGAQRAVVMNDRPLMGRKIKVEKATKRGANTPGSR